MRRSALLAMLLVPLACGDDARTEAGAPADGPVADRPAPEPRLYAIVRGGDTLATERFTRTDERVEGEIASTGAGTSVGYDVQLGPEGRVRHARFRVRADTAAPPISATLDVRGDSIFITEGDDSATARSQRRALPAGATVYLTPSVGLLEPLVQYARAGGPAGSAGSDTVSIPVFTLSLDQDPRLVDSRIVLSQDSVWIEGTPGHRVTLGVGENGRIRAGANPPQNIRVVPLE